jgi:hypothetical protein
MSQALQLDASGIEMALACPFKPLSYNLDKQHRPGKAIQAHAGSFRLRVSILTARCVTLQQGFETLGRGRSFCIRGGAFPAIGRLDPLLEVATFNICLVMSGYPWVSEALQVLKLALRWPDVPVILTNGGQINISGLGQADASLALRTAPNLYIDTAGIYRQDFIEETAQEFGAERILFGSGSPYFDQRYEIKRVQVAKLPAGDLQVCRVEMPPGYLA